MGGCPLVFPGTAPLFHVVGPVSRSFVRVAVSGAPPHLAPLQELPPDSVLGAGCITSARGPCGPPATFVRPRCAKQLRTGSSCPATLVPSLWSGLRLPAGSILACALGAVRQSWVLASPGPRSSPSRVQRCRGTSAWNSSLRAASYLVSSGFPVDPLCLTQSVVDHPPGAFPVGFDPVFVRFARVPPSGSATGCRSSCLHSPALRLACAVLRTPRITPLLCPREQIRSATVEVALDGPGSSGPSDPSDRSLFSRSGPRFTPFPA